MPVNYILENDHDIAVQAEVTYGLDPGAPTATQFFKHQAGPGMIERVIARYDRQLDRDYQQGSVLTTAKGRESSKLSIPFDVIPNGTAATPTLSDIHPVLLAHFQTHQLGTAHTTTAAGSTGVTLNLTAGGGAASGIPTTGGVLIAVDIAAGAYEVRRVISRATDVVTVDLAFTSNPAAAQTVKVGTTYRFSSSQAPRSVTVKQYLNGTTKRTKVTGVIFPDLSIDCDASSQEIVVKGNVSGVGQQHQTHADARPTIVTTGVPLSGIVGKIWIGASKFCATKVGFNSNNGMELRQNEFCSLNPRGVKRTANNSRFTVGQSLDLFYTSGDEDVHTIYDNAQSLTPQSVIVQLGNSPGNIVAWATPRFIADPKLMAINGEFGVTFGGGRCYGTAADDEIFFAII